MVTKWGFRNLLQNWHQKLNQIIMRISVGGGTFWILHAGKGGARVLIGALRVRTLWLSWVNCELTIWICFTYSSQKKAISSTISPNLSESFRDLIIWPFSLFPNRYATPWRHRINLIRERGKKEGRKRSFPLLPWKQKMEHLLFCMQSTEQRI